MDIYEEELFFLEPDKHTTSRPEDNGCKYMEAIWRIREILADNSLEESEYYKKLESIQEILKELHL